MLPMERIPYSPITRRPKLALPNGKRVAVWVLVSIEEWDINSPMPRTVNTPPAGGVPTPDIPNWTWHEYGNRVGFWRLAETLDKFGIKASMAINGVAVKTYAPIAEAARERGWEFIAHGYTQKNLQKVEDERADIRKTRDVIAAVHRPGAARLGRARSRGDLEYAGRAGRRGIFLRLRLGA